MVKAGTPSTAIHCGPGGRSLVWSPVDGSPAAAAARRVRGQEPGAVPVLPLGLHHGPPHPGGHAHQPQAPPRRLPRPPTARSPLTPGMGQTAGGNIADGTVLRGVIEIPSRRSPGRGCPRARPFHWSCGGFKRYGTPRFPIVRMGSQPTCRGSEGNPNTQSPKKTQPGRNTPRSAAPWFLYVGFTSHRLRNPL